MNIPLPDATVLSSTPAEQDLHRQLIEQFYKTSVERYGLESEQTRIFAQHLSAYTDQRLIRQT